MKSLTHLEMIVAERDKLVGLLAQTLHILESGNPPKGGRTDTFIKKAKKTLHG